MAEGDRILGTADDIHEQENTTTPFVDQNQTYTSHPSHQAFLRAYTLDANGHPVATGKLITNMNLGADGHFGGSDADADTELGGMATWAPDQRVKLFFPAEDGTPANLAEGVRAACHPCREPASGQGFRGSELPRRERDRA